MKRAFITILLIFSGSFLFAQDFDEILKNVEDKNRNRGDFKVNMSYTLYKGEKSSKPFESYKGLLVKKGKGVYSKINNTEMVATEDFFIKVNHDEKAMVCTTEKDDQNVASELDLGLLLSFFDKGKLEDNGESWSCELNAKMFSQVPYSKVVLIVQKSDYSVSKQIFYYASRVDFSSAKLGKDYDVARLEIEYNNTLKISSLDDAFFEKKNYVKLVNQKSLPVGKYKNYEIIDVNL